MKDYFNCIEKISTTSGTYTIYSLKKLEAQGIVELNRIPYSIKIFLENVLRNCDESQITASDVTSLANWAPFAEERPILPFKPARGSDAGFHRCSCIG